MMKAALAGALGGYQSLAHDDAREKPVDRVAAAGAAQVARAKDAERTAALAGLGVDLIRFKFAHIATARLDTEDRLMIALAWRHKADDLSPRERAKVARWAVQEWSGDACPPRPRGCGGAGFVPDHENHEGAQPMRPCPVCGGTRLRRYTDQDRIAAMGALYPQAMEEAHAIIAWAESLAVQRARALLERY